MLRHQWEDGVTYIFTVADKTLERPAPEFLSGADAEGVWADDTVLDRFTAVGFGVDPGTNKSIRYFVAYCTVCGAISGIATHDLGSTPAVICSGSPASRGSCQEVLVKAIHHGHFQYVPPGGRYICTCSKCQGAMGPVNAGQKPTARLNRATYLGKFWDEDALPEVAIEIASELALGNVLSFAITADGAREKATSTNVLSLERTVSRLEGLDVSDGCHVTWRPTWAHVGGQSFVVEAVGATKRVTATVTVTVTVGEIRVAYGADLPLTAHPGQTQRVSLEPVFSDGTPVPSYLARTLLYGCDENTVGLTCENPSDSDPRAYLQWTPEWACCRAVGDERFQASLEKLYEVGIQITFPLRTPVTGTSSVQLRVFNQRPEIWDLVGLPDGFARVQDEEFPLWYAGEILEGETIGFTGLAADPDADPLTFMWTRGARKVGASRFDSNGAVTWIPPFGRHTVAFSVNDAGLLVDRAGLTIDVKKKDPPKPPTPLPIPPPTPVSPLIPLPSGPPPEEPEPEPEPTSEEPASPSLPVIQAIAGRRAEDPADPARDRTVIRVWLEATTREGSACTRKYQMAETAGDPLHAAILEMATAITATGAPQRTAAAVRDRLIAIVKEKQPPLAATLLEAAIMAIDTAAQDAIKSIYRRQHPLVTLSPGEDDEWRYVEEIPPTPPSSPGSARLTQPCPLQAATPTPARYCNVQAMYIGIAHGSTPPAPPPTAQPTLGDRWKKRLTPEFIEKLYADAGALSANVTAVREGAVQALKTLAGKWEPQENLQHAKRGSPNGSDVLAIGDKQYVFKVVPAAGIRGTGLTYAPGSVAGAPARALSGPAPLKLTEKLSLANSIAENGLSGVAHPIPDARKAFAGSSLTDDPKKVLCYDFPVYQKHRPWHTNLAADSSGVFGFLKSIRKNADLMASAFSLLRTPEVERHFLAVYSCAVPVGSLDRTPQLAASIEVYPSDRFTLSMRNGEVPSIGFGLEGSYIGKLGADKAAPAGEIDVLMTAGLKAVIARVDRGLKLSAEDKELVAATLKVPMEKGMEALKPLVEQAIKALDTSAQTNTVVNDLRKLVYPDATLPTLSQEVFRKLDRALRQIKTAKKAIAAATDGSVYNAGQLNPGDATLLSVCDDVSTDIAPTGDKERAQKDERAGLAPPLPRGFKIRLVRNGKQEPERVARPKLPNLDFPKVDWGNFPEILDWLKITFPEIDWPALPDGLDWPKLANLPEFNLAWANLRIRWPELQLPEWPEMSIAWPSFKGLSLPRWPAFHVPGFPAMPEFPNLMPRWELLANLALSTVLGGLLDIINAITCVWDMITSLVPSYGVYLEFDLAVMKGALDWNWQYLEDTNEGVDPCKVYLHQSGKAELMLFKISVGLYFGIKVPGFSLLIGGGISGQFNLNAKWNTVKKGSSGWKVELEAAYTFTDNQKETRPGATPARGETPPANRPVPVTPGSHGYRPDERGDGWSAAAFVARLEVKVQLVSARFMQAKAGVKSGYEANARLLVPGVEDQDKNPTPSIEWELYFLGVELFAEASMKLFNVTKEVKYPLVAGDPKGQPRRSGVFPRSAKANFYQLRKEIAILSHKVGDAREALANAIQRYQKLIRWVATDNKTPLENNLGFGRAAGNGTSSFRKSVDLTREAALRSGADPASADYFAALTARLESGGLLALVQAMGAGTAIPASASGDRYDAIAGISDETARMLEYTKAKIHLDDFLDRLRDVYFEKQWSHSMDIAAAKNLKVSNTTYWESFKVLTRAKRNKYLHESLAKWKAECDSLSKALQDQDIELGLILRDMNTLTRDLVQSEQEADRQASSGGGPAAGPPPSLRFLVNATREKYGKTVKDVKAITADFLAAQEALRNRSILRSVGKFAYWRSPGEFEAPPSSGA